MNRGIEPCKEVRSPDFSLRTTPDHQGAGPPVHSRTRRVVLARMHRWLRRPTNIGGGDAWMGDVRHGVAPRHDGLVRTDLLAGLDSAIQWIDRKIFPRSRHRQLKTGATM